MATLTTLDDMLAAYLLPYSGQTYVQYRNALRAWLRWCDLNNIDPLNVRRSHIEAYSQWKSTRHTIATVRDTVGAVCRFYTFLTDEQVFTANPAAGVRLPRKYQHSPGGFLTREQAQSFLDTARALGAQEYALCALLLLAGPRISEALNLDVEDWDGAAHTLHYQRKGHFMQEVRVSGVVAAALTAHIRHRRHGPIFRSPTGRRLRGDDARNLVHMVGAQVGRPDLTPHSLRRTFCTLAVEAGVPDRDIMAACGWSGQGMVTYYDMGRRGTTQRAGDAVAGLFDL